MFCCHIKRTKHLSGYMGDEKTCQFDLSSLLLLQQLLLLLVL